MSSVDVSMIVNPIIEVAGTVLAAVVTMLVSKLLAEFERRTDIKLTAQQRETVYGAINTATGLVNMALQKGALKVSDVHVDNPQIAGIASAALIGVQEAAGALGVTQKGAVHMIVGRVGQALGAPTPPPVITGLPQYTSGLLNVMPCATTTSTTQGT